MLDKLYGVSCGAEPASCCWFDFPRLHVEVSLGNMLNPKTAPDVLVGTLHCSHQYMYELVSVFS